MTYLKITTALFALTIYVLSFLAINDMGLAGVNLFFTDFSHPWRAQFNADFSMYLLMTMAWAFYRESTLPARIFCSFFMMFGGVFFFPYVLVATIRSKGNPAVFFMGNHVKPEADNGGI